MSEDLVKRLRDGTSDFDDWEDAATRIGQLERELAIAEKMAADANEAYSQAHTSMVEALDQLAAERALADRLGRFVLKLHGEAQAATAYRKARGL